MGLKLDLMLLLGASLLISASADNKANARPCCPGANILGKGGCRQGKSHDPAKINLDCPNGMYTVDPLDDPSDVFTVDSDGSLSIYSGKHVIEKNGYCLTKKSYETTSDENTTLAQGTDYVEIAMVCFIDEEDDDTYLTYTVTGSLIFTSVVFLVLTLAVYILVPELRDLQGKCIMCTCLCLCLGFLQLGISQLFLHTLSTLCVLIAFSTYFWMLTIFFWMNIVSINVLRSVIVKKPTMSDNRLFQIYSLYGWGVPLIFLLAAVIAHHAEGDHIKPGFGHISCWLAGNTATWAYFYGPIGSLIIANIILFIMTSLKLWHTTSYENAGALRSLKYKFLLYLKLFLVMGISWTFEIMSFVHDQSHIVWVIADTFNCLQGVVFFLVLIVFRRRALRGLAERGLLPQSWTPKGPRNLDEECDEIVAEEEIPAISTP